MKIQTLAVAAGVSAPLIPKDNLTITPGFPIGITGSVIEGTDFGWGVTPIEAQGDPFDPVNTFPGNGHILIGQFTGTPGSTAISGTFLFQYTSNGNQFQQDVVNFHHPPKVINVTQGLHYVTIQEAIVDAVDGDEIDVNPGHYVENVVFGGKAIQIRSTQGPDVTTIEAPANGSTVIINNTMLKATRLEGFTVTGGTGTLSEGRKWGGGLLILNGNPTIENCVFRENSADFGGGVFMDWSSPSFFGCSFVDNEIRDAGGALPVGGAG